MTCLIQIISSCLYSFSLFLSVSAAFLLFLRGALVWGLLCLLASFALSVFGLLILDVLNRYCEFDVL